jgi:Mg2+/Co2+ transporter CorB
VAALLARPRALLVSILLVANIANVAYLVVSSVIALGTEPATPLRPAPQGLLALAFSAVAVLALILFTDLLPKLLARRLRVEFCRAFARLMLAVFRAIGPVQRVLDALLIAPLSRLVRPRAAPPPVLTVD